MQIRLYAEHLEVYYKDHLVERMERVRGEREARVDYRHIIGSLVRKPGAFARYRFREQMFPTMTFRLSYDALKRWRAKRADVEYVRILHLSATTMESTVDSALALLLEAGEPFDYGTVKELANPAPPRAPVLSLPGMLDDLGYLPQGAEESEVLFTLIAERYDVPRIIFTSSTSLQHSTEGV